MQAGDVERLMGLDLIESSATAKCHFLTWRTGSLPL
jgi:hypothetical protein